MLQIGRRVIDDERFAGGALRIAVTNYGRGARLAHRLLQQDTEGTFPNATFAGNNGYHLRLCLHSAHAP
jgi:hypothetical protein